MNIQHFCNCVLDTGVIQTQNPNTRTLLYDACVALGEPQQAVQTACAKLNEVRQGMASVDCNMPFPELEELINRRYYKDDADDGETLRLDRLAEKEVEEQMEQQLRCTLIKLNEDRILAHDDFVRFEAAITTGH